MMNAVNKEIDKYPRQVHGGLRGASLFFNLSDQEIACFNDAAKARSYKKGSLLYLQEDVAEFFYVICGGWIKLFHTMPEGEEVTVDMLTTGHMVGENAIFEHGHHTSSAQAIEDVQLLKIPSNLLMEQIRLNFKLAFNLLSSMSRHHRRHYGELALNATQNAPQRIGCFLLRLCPLDKKNDIVFQLPYDKTLIASNLGMESATFSRALNILRLKTAIRISGTRVEVDSVERLVKFVYGSHAESYVPEEM